VFELLAELPTQNSRRTCFKSRTGAADMAQQGSFAIEDQADATELGFEHIFRKRNANIKRRSPNTTMPTQFTSGKRNAAGSFLRYQQTSFGTPSDQ